MEKTFEIFDWENYINYYDDLKHVKTKEEAWNHWFYYGVNENRIFFNISDTTQKDYFYNLFNIETQKDDKNLNLLKQNFEEFMDMKKKFDWLKYVDDNKDLTNILDLNQAWHHWILHGRRENRCLPVINEIITNNTEIHNGRFGNLFFINMVLHFISKRYDLKTSYKYYDQFLNLGIDLYIGKKTYQENNYLTELNYFELMNKKSNFTNIIVTNNSWFQNYEFCLFLEIYFNEIQIKNKIISHNKFSDRYKVNNDLFIHVRLDDIEKNNLHNTFNYYDKIIQKHSFANGYISSDNLNSSICKELISKYSLNVINLNEEETIMFGSTCNIIILSGGTFSWLIGFLSFYSEYIYYPNNIQKWYGDIFIYKNWTGVNTLEDLQPPS
jgi:hypothetical protein